MTTDSHTFVFSIPSRSLSFAFIVNAKGVAKMGPKSRAKELTLTKSRLVAAALHLNELADNNLNYALAFAEFHMQVMDHATSEIGNV